MDWDRDALETLLIETLQRDILDDAEELDPDSGLEEAGLDSLGLTQLLLRVEEETGLWLDDRYLTPEHLRTVRTLAECIETVLHEQ